MKALLLLILFVLASIHLAQAQQPSKVPRIGFLGVRLDASKSTFDLLKREFQALGYVDGKNIAFEYRNAENEPERLPALVDELIRLKVDVLIVAATNEAHAARKATKTIPVVGLNLGDPVASGLVGSLARPGGNVTGFTPISGELSGKRLEILKETIPKLSRVAVLWDPKVPAGEKTLKEIRLSATALGLQGYSMEVSATDKFDNALKEAIKAGSGALTVNLSAMINSNQRRITELAARYRLPAIYPRAEFAHSGGLMSYGADRLEGFKRVAIMVDKILKGTEPADLPVEQPTKFEFTINLNAAKRIGLTIPPNVLARADKVIK